MKSIVGFIARFKDGWAVGAAQSLVSKGQLKEARELLYARWRSNGRPFPSTEASLVANAMAASINYHLGQFEEAVESAEAALSSPRLVNNADHHNQTYIVEFCKEIRSEVLDAGTSVIYRSTFYRLGSYEPKISRRYLRYFPLRENMKPASPNGNESAIA